MNIKPGTTPEFKTLTGEVKAVGDEDGNGEFEAILSTEAVDRDGESIALGAFDPLPKSIPIFYQHDWREGASPVGRGEPFYDGKALKIRGSYASTPRAQEMRALVTEGIVDSMSVGFLNAKRASVGGQKSVTKADLFESSFTAIPVNNTATVLASKAVEGKAGARNSKADAAHIQAAHDHMAAIGASCDTTKSVSVKAIEGTVEALQARVRDALEAAYGDWGTYLRGVDPDKGLVFFDWYAGDGDTYQQSFTDDGAVVTLNGDATEVDIHEVVVPDADADREPADTGGPTMLSTSTADAAGKAAAPEAAAPPAAEAADDEDDLAIRAVLLSIDATAATA